MAQILPAAPSSTAAPAGCAEAGGAGAAAPAFSPVSPPAAAPDAPARPGPGGAPAGVGARVLALQARSDELVAGRVIGLWSGAVVRPEVYGAAAPRPEHQVIVAPAAAGQPPVTVVLPPAPAGRGGLLPRVGDDVLLLTRRLAGGERMLLWSSLAYVRLQPVRAVNQQDDTFLSVMVIGDPHWRGLARAATPATREPSLGWDQAAPPHLVASYTLYY